MLFGQRQSDVRLAQSHGIGQQGAPKDPDRAQESVKGAPLVFPEPGRWLAVVPRTQCGSFRYPDDPIRMVRDAWVDEPPQGLAHLMERFRTYP